MSRLKILSVLQLLGHPRDSKRIAMLQESGFDVGAVAFERDYHSGRLPSCRIETLGKISHGRYITRMARLPFVFWKLRRAIKKNHVVYASGPDMALMSLVSGFGLQRPIIVEVGDVRNIQTARGLMGKFVRFIDRWVVESCQLIVVTAPKFYDTYYREWLRTSTTGLVIENKLEASFVEQVEEAGVSAPEGVPLVDRPLRIGYFGLLRDEWSWSVLESLAKNRPDKFEVVLAGMPMKSLVDLPRRIASYPNVEYRGEYRSPGDLPTLYNSVDMVWVCYPPIQSDDWNLRWARPNRFYQSCLFRKPLFSRAGCQDAVDVARYGIGRVIHEVEVESASQTIQNISADDIKLWSSNMANLAASVFAYTDEVDNLRRRILSIVGRDSQAE